MRVKCSTGIWLDAITRAAGELFWGQEVKPMVLIVHPTRYKESFSTPAFILLNISNDPCLGEDTVITILGVNVCVYRSTDIPCDEFVLLKKE